MTEGSGGRDGGKGRGGGGICLKVRQNKGETNEDSRSLHLLSGCLTHPLHTFFFPFLFSLSMLSLKIRRTLFERGVSVRT